MIIATADVFVQIPQRRAAERVMLAAQGAARQRDGCVSYVFAEALGEHGHFVLVQRWRDRGALETHYRTESFATYQAAIAPLLVRDSILEIHVVEEAVRPVESSGLDINQDD